MSDNPVRFVAVIDIGKTNAKLALVDLDAGAEVAVRKAPNVPRNGAPYPHHNTEALWRFILEALTDLGKGHAVHAISITTHGATAALIDESGALALPVLDYEFAGPNGLRGDYEKVRPSFAETGSPPLPSGLNLGAQLFWQAQNFPDAFARAKSILMYPQYWAFRLCGVAAGEATSLGCHTDLWNPQAKTYSPLVGKMGWDRLMPPVRLASERLGTLLPELAARTGLPRETPVFCGIHDSNASLLPHVLGRPAPFAVVSSGTWVVVMAVGAEAKELDPARDTLVNVNALGDPVPSARFMGGREFSLLTEGLAEAWTEADLRAVLEGPLMLLPAVERNSGPFQGRAASWIGGEPASGEKRVAASFYLVMMTATCLDLIGAAGDTIVEGPLAGNELFCRMLAAATGRRVRPSEGATGTSLGAALLADPGRDIRLEGRAMPAPGEAWVRYAAHWREAVAAGEKLT